ncbi:uncharacterized protein BO87DRAFT_446338 [Aspergillus neoniger CBS 115656]|uniref:Uncharacterized protein n=1 Tax=Aspergillus neoniger (strain CBS 115656) TaxID=1448310 RepID=A0A318YWT7_ASPNB|nr:hypothetical protein BO87DRAFT_446338 [Aspergillus neoniger CBS 115656]PYH38427.1 hypothetical protein BO87DRAFT_446338 [Aspergillus neoniger CBS 115656]
MILLRIWANLLPFLLLQLPISPTVNAGHPEWEHARFMLPEWVSVKSVEPWSRLWPDKTVKLCYESEATWRKYHNYYRNAMRLWYASGLSEDFKVREVGRDGCQNTPHEQLLVMDTPEMLATFVGFPSMSYLNPNNGPPPTAPAMYVSLLPSDTEEYRVGSIAHELAHSFGLHHEHQNPYYWHRGRELFVFDCEALSDYTSFTEGLSEAEIWEPDGVCTSYKEADHLGATPTNYLPLPFDEVLTPKGMWVGKDDVDWNSIMLYGSTTGGKRDENGEKEAVLMTSDFQLWPEPQTPTPDDVTGLSLLYTTVYGIPVRTLFNDPRSPSFSTFRQYAGCST